MSGDGRPTRRHDLWDDDETGPESTPARDDSTSPEPAPAAAGEPSTPADEQPRRSHRSEDDRATRRPAWLLPVAVLLVLALCGGGAFAALRGGGDDSACGGRKLTVAAGGVLSLIHISEPTRLYPKSRMASSA